MRVFNRNGAGSHRLADAVSFKHLFEPLHLIGNSMGGHISALYAARYPGKVLSLALLDNAAQAELVDQAAIAGRPEGLGEGHGDLAACR